MATHVCEKKLHVVHDGFWFRGGFITGLFVLIYNVLRAVSLAFESPEERAIARKLKKNYKRSIRKGGKV